MDGPQIVRAWGYPITPIVFMALSLWMIYFFITEKPEIFWWFIIAIVPAFIVYAVSKTIENQSK